MNNPVVTRFAPTPSGFLHQGNAFNFLLTWLLARRAGGRIRLRIDDMDEDRVRQVYLDDIFRSLDWLGLDWDDGPFSVEAHQRDFRQRLRREAYDAALLQLKSQGWLFPCECSRKDIAALPGDGSYPGTCRQKGLSWSNADLAWRVKTPWPWQEAWTDEGMGEVLQVPGPTLRDAVLRKKDGWPAYQLSSLVDDRLYGTTLVVRGADLLDSTAFQRWLEPGLGGDLFRSARYWHHPLKLDAEGAKLSKSAGSISLRHQYEQEQSPRAMLQAFASWMGWEGAEVETTQDLLLAGSSFLPGQNG